MPGSLLFSDGWFHKLQWLGQNTNVDKSLFSCMSITVLNINRFEFVMAYLRFNGAVTGAQFRSTAHIFSFQIM